MTVWAVLVLTAAVAAANGANDSAKGVATLAGSGMARYRSALAWGIASTLAGALASISVAAGISTLFTKGIVSAPASSAFSLAALAGTLGWVALATVASLPVSTTHAIVGSLLGAGLVLARHSIAWGSLAGKVVLPLLLGAAAAYAITGVLVRLVRHAPRCVCIEVGVPHAVGASPGTGDGAAVLAAAPPTAAALRVEVGARERCPVHDVSRRRLRVDPLQAHWVTSGAIGFSRGLNDTPKIWALGAAALVPATLGRGELLVLVAASMAVGGAVAGIRVGRRLGGDVIAMGHREGFAANLTTATLVGGGATLGLPMSTTHVASGAIAGIAGRDTRRLNTATLRQFLIAWTITPAVAGLTAAAIAALVG